MAAMMIPELNVPIVFQHRPTSIPADLRPGWKIGIILLLLRKCCRQNTSSFGRLHVLSWGVRSKDSRLALSKTSNGNMPLDALIVRIEPSVNRAVDYAIGAGLIERLSKDRLKLTSAGIAFADEVDRRKDLFITEKQFMDAIGKKITESLVNQIFKKGE